MIMARTIGVKLVGINRAGLTGCHSAQRGGASARLVSRSDRIRRVIGGAQWAVGVFCDES